MKRTRDIRHARFRKRLMLSIGVLAAPMLLMGCDQTPTTQPFSTIAQCQQQYNYTASHCRQLYNQAIDQAKVTGPQYRSQSDCVADNRNDPQARQQCQYTSHGSSAHYFYVPRYYSYSPGSYAQPFYRGHGNEYRSATGKPFTPTSGGYTRPVTRTTTITRGGFGSTASSHSSSSHGSGGHSSGG